MRALFATGRAADLALLALALEAGVVARRARLGRGPAPAEFVGVWGAGAGLLLALRGALRGARWGWIALPLAGAGVVHLADLRRRASGERQRPGGQQQPGGQQRPGERRAADGRRVPGGRG